MTMKLREAYARKAVRDLADELVETHYVAPAMRELPPDPPGRLATAGRIAVILAAAVLLGTVLVAALTGCSPPQPAAHRVAVAPVAADAPTIKLPTSLDGQPGAFIRVASETNGREVRWFAATPGLNIFPADMLRDSRSTVVVANVTGEYRLIAYTALGDVPSEPAECRVVVGGISPPVVVPPGPAPVNPPVVVPMPAGHVLIVTEESTGESDPWLTLLNSPTFRAWLDTKKVKYRILDKDSNMAHADPVWQEGMKIPRQSIPWLIASNGTNGYSGPLPKTEAEAVELLGRYFP